MLFTQYIGDLNMLFTQYIGDLNILFTLYVGDLNCKVPFIIYLIILKSRQFLGLLSVKVPF